MDLTSSLEEIRADLEAIAGSDETTLAVAERLVRALEPSMRLRLLEALGQVAIELSDQLPAGRVEVRLLGRDVQLAYIREEVVAEVPSADEESGTARLTLRMPERLKARVEEQASRERVSTNAWLVRAVTRGLEQRRKVGNRLTGFARS